MEKKYKPEIIEGKWQEKWNDSMYYFEGSPDKEPYIIDTPPPYPTGDFHIGNALNWCYIDFIARYKRMRGYDVLFPQGWDCHGLPTRALQTTYLGKYRPDEGNDETAWHVHRLEQRVCYDGRPL